MEPINPWIEWLAAQTCVRRTSSCSKVSFDFSDSGCLRAVANWTWNHQSAVTLSFFCLPTLGQPERGLNDGETQSHRCRGGLPSMSHPSMWSLTLHSVVSCEHRLFRTRISHDNDYVLQMYHSWSSVQENHFNLRLKETIL